jgi:DNA-binding LytR/AlgR family response regulator
MIKAIAIDDEPYALEVVKMLSEKVPFVSLEATFTNCFDAIPYIQEQKIDLLFLDINMPDISGIEFVNTLPKCPMVIFTTAYSEYAVKGFELDAIDYLLKPFSLARFTKACNKAFDNKKNFSTQKEPDFIFLKTGYEEEKVRLDEIYYVEAEGNYMTYWMGKNKKLLTRQTISEVLEMLPTDQFSRIHRSFVVANSKIEKFSRNSVWILEKEIPVGNTYEQVLKNLRHIFKID